MQERKTRDQRSRVKHAEFLFCMKQVYSFLHYFGQERDTRLVSYGFSNPSNYIIS